MVPEGSSVDLSCELNDPSVAVTLWQMLGSGGMYTPRKNLANYGQLFTLHNFNNNMQGTYICRARKRGFSQNIGMIYLKSSPKGNEEGLSLSSYSVTTDNTRNNRSCYIADPGCSKGG